MSEIEDIDASGAIEDRIVRLAKNATAQEIKTLSEAYRALCDGFQAMRFGPQGGVLSTSTDYRYKQDVSTSTRTSYDYHVTHHKDGAGRDGLGFGDA